MQIISNIEHVLEASRDIENALAMEKYMRNKFPFLGLKSPERKNITAQFVKKFKESEKEVLIDLLYQLWDKDEREYQYLALDMAKKNYSLLKNEIENGVVKHLILQKSWWDTVDLIAVHIVGSNVLKNKLDSSFLDSWIDDENIWLKRTAILYQLKFKNKTDLDKVFGYCNKTKNHPDFFIRKAIGWQLREQSKLFPTEVRKYMEENKDSLSKLSISEGAKYL
jgi:3-methyladenine DNA glycosylase AlkD